MLRKTNAFAFVAILTFLFACSNPTKKDTTSGDAGDSATIGTGTDTVGSMVDTGAANDADTAKAH